jgi:hypothetical protein
MSKIYIITRGEFDEYHIVAATTSESKAAKLLDICNSANRNAGNLAKIEEYDDSDMDNEFKPVWNCYMDGDNVTAYPADCVMCEIENAKNYIDLWNVCKTTDGEYAVDVAATDEETAKKIAKNIIAEYKTI